MKYLIYWSCLRYLRYQLYVILDTSDIHEIYDILEIYGILEIS